ncbi:hypothetical protein SH601_05440 [Gracilibacillus sp. S3-1-1]|uniref:Uncharacterized protein n=1 Tax=Gracilibacillus pellucidus TaxID=3095368 RepID=A0ACC6M3H3_9BACI|nr:hypothetical protein [Gracilibacillus sp. S3-1-1]MDX8045428.1 hypothetical protein [Gracilibacillus sp. S3-1-1]
MEIIVIFGFYLLPIISIVFCYNLIAVIRKIHEDDGTYFNGFLMTASFIAIVVYFALLIASTQ